MNPVGVTPGPWYCVSFHTIVEARNGAFDVSRTLALPFVPYPGLVVDGVRFKDDGFVVGLVRYDVGTGLFDVAADGRDDAPHSIFRWDTPFDTETARDFMAYGCEVDGFTDPAEWEREVLVKYCGITPRPSGQMPAP